MTQLGQNKKAVQKPKVVITEELKKEEPAPLDEYSELVERLKKEKPDVYQTYLNAAKSGKRAKIGDDLSLRVG